MLRISWLTHDEGRLAWGQVYHPQPIPVHLQLELIDNGRESRFKTAPEPGAVQCPLATPSGDVERNGSLAREHAQESAQKHT